MSGNAADDLLSQSYCTGIYKIAVIKNASYNNFQVPENILEERKKAWNDLFEKYSAMVSGVELNVHTLQPEGEMILSEITEQRLPMRKSMSMVQYWVETGNLAHTNCTSNPLGLVSESSTVEDNNLELTQNLDSPSLTSCPSAEKHSNFAGTSGNKNTRIITVSNSSLDTAAYILANNHVTKKAETIAIVEGSKVSSEIPSPTKNFPEMVEMATSKNHISLAKKNNSNKLDMENTNFSQSILFTSYVDKITENMKNANLDKKCSSKMISMSKQQENRICSIFSSDSNESQNPNLQNRENVINNHTSNNLSQAIKRKKLYKQSDSPAEFTPVSEDNLSLKTSRLLIEKCLTLRSSEHPALETPKVSSRFLARTRFGVTKSKRKLDQDQGFSFVCTTNNPISRSHEILDPSKINNIIRLTSNKNCTRNSNATASQTISQDEYIQKNNFHNSVNITRQSYLNQPNETDKAFECMENTLTSCDDFLETKLELKSCQVLVQRLPHKYYLSSSSEQITKNDKSFDTTKYYVCSQNFIKNPPDYAFKSNIAWTNNAKQTSSTYFANNLSENTTDIRTHNFKTFGDIKIVQDKLGYKGKQPKCPDKRNSVYSWDKFKILDMKDSASNIYPMQEILTKHLKMTKQENLCKIKSKYVIADSSSDESDLIVPLSIKKNQLVSKSRNPKKLSSKSESLSHQLSKSKSEIVGSFTAVENDENFNKPTCEDSSKNCSNEQKMSTENFFENYKIDNVVQYNQLKENVYLDTCKYNMLPSDCNKRKHQVKNMSIISSSSKEETEKSIATRKQLQTVNLAIKCKQSAESTHAILSKNKNTSNNMTHDHVLLHEFHQINNKADINNKSSKLVFVRDKLNILNTPNKKKKQVSHTSLNDNNQETWFEFALTNPVNDDELPSAHAHVSQDSLKIEKNELSLAKPTQLGGGQPNIKDLVKIVSTVTPKISTKKRSSYEIDLSSDEECIIPLKKYEKKL